MRQRSRCGLPMVPRWRGPAAGALILPPPRRPISSAARGRRQQRRQGSSPAGERPRARAPAHTPTAAARQPARPGRRRVITLGRGAKFRIRRAERRHARVRRLQGRPHPTPPLALMHAPKRPASGSGFPQKRMRGPRGCAGRKRRRHARTNTTRGSREPRWERAAPQPDARTAAPRDHTAPPPGRPGQPRPPRPARRAAGKEGASTAGGAPPGPQPKPRRVGGATPLPETSGAWTAARARPSPLGSPRGAREPSAASLGVPGGVGVG